MTSNISWQDVLTKSARLHDKSADDRKKAGVLLWTGAQTAVTEWVGDGVSTDPSAEKFQNDVMDVLGKSRKGDVSKIKTVALAVKNNNLDMTGNDLKGKPIKSLTQAYALALHLTKTVKQVKDDDAAADKAVADIAKAAVDTAVTPEDAAKMVLAKGLDEAARLLLDALGATNEPAHRALLRAVSAEVAGRVVKPVKAAATGPKAGATQVKSAPKKAASATPVKAKPKTAAPVAKPTTSAAVAPKKATPAKAQPQPINKQPVPVGTQPKKTAAPVVKRPAGRAAPVKA